MSSSVAERKQGVALKERTSEDLRRELIGLVGLAADNLLRMAAIVVELERRGEDLSGLRLSLLPHLRRIAAQQLLPETVVHFSFSPRLLNQVSQLPVSEQRRLLENPEVEVYLPETDTTEKVELGNLHTRQSHAVFGAGRIRTPAEQKAYIRGAINPAKKEDAPAPRTYRVRPDRERGGLWVGNSFVKTAEIVSALAELAGPLPSVPLDESETATARLTAEEKEKLRLAEKRRGLPEWHLIREALRAYGLI